MRQGARLLHDRAPIRRTAWTELDARHLPLVEMTRSRPPDCDPAVRLTHRVAASEAELSPRSRPRGAMRNTDFLGGVSYAFVAWSISQSTSGRHSSGMVESSAR